MRNIQTALEHATAHSQKPLAQGMISLIIFSRPDASTADACYNHEVLFVKWESVNLDPRKARRVRLDRQNRVVYNVPYAVPIEEFPVEATKLIVSDLPVLMLRMAGKLRDQMPEFALTLQGNLKTTSFSGPLHVESPEQRCVLCRAAETFEIDGVLNPEDETFQCCQCNLAWHTHCASYMCINGAGGLRLDGTSFLCPCCQE
jgi:hypothetical protein